MDETQIDEQVRKNNKKKLLIQNKKLYNDLKKLQTDINALEADDEEKHKVQPSYEHLKSQIQGQQKEIRKLKELIQAARKTNIKQNVIYIRKEENDLLCLKKQSEELYREKETVTSAHQDKLKKLAGNEPLQKHKDSLQALWAQTKKVNRQLSLKLVELEREIRKYHSIKERSKNKEINNSHNEQVELSQIQSQIARLQSQIKSKELKWKPNTEILDSDFFSLKNTLSNAQRKIAEYEKEDNIWKMRANALRGHDQLQSDRQRLFKVASLPKAEPVVKTQQNKQRYKRMKSVAEINEKRSLLSSQTKKNSLPRAQSTPNPPGTLKRSIDLKDLAQSAEVKKREIIKNRIGEKKELSSQKQVITALQKAKGSKKQDKELSALLSEAPIYSPGREVTGDENNKKKEQSWVQLRDKHRIKSSVNPQFAQQLKQKLTEAKKINETMRVQIVKSPKSDRQSLKGLDIQKNKQSQVHKIKINQAVVQPQRKESPATIKRQSSVVKKQRLSQSVNSKERLINEKHSKPEITVSTQKRLKAISHKEKERVVNLNMETLKVKQSSENKSIKSSEPQPHQNYEKAVSTSPKKEARPVQKVLQSSKGIQKSEKPKFDIKISDSGTKDSPKIAKKTQLVIGKDPSVAEMAQEDLEGVPKIIRRKRPVEGKMATTGTST